MEVLLLDSRGETQRITERNQRHYRNRRIVCNSCGSVSEFDELPHSCSKPTCSNDFTDGSDSLEDGNFWWNDAILRKSRVLIIGCGAIGNEVVKNLALAGVKRFTLVDFDSVEESNRARAVLFNSSSIKDSLSNLKVEVMATALSHIDEEIEVTRIPKGIPDELSVEHNSKVEPGGERPLLSGDEVMELASNHDVAVIGTDGMAPHSKFNRLAYTLIPQVRGAMNETGEESSVAVTLPYTTFCLECAELNHLSGISIRKPSDPSLPSTVRAGRFDYQEFYAQTGFNCKDAAALAGAASFAHANSVIGAQMTAQALLILHGFSDFRESGLRLWPDGVPKPIINQAIRFSTFHPLMSNRGIPMETSRYVDGPYHCQACNWVFRGDSIADLEEHYNLYNLESAEESPRLNPNAKFWEKKASVPPPSTSR